MWKVTLDACALFSATVRELLLYFAAARMYMPHWNAEINKEWISGLVTRRKELRKEDLRMIANKMNEDFPEANISGLSKLIKGLTLPDANDRHVLAAAIISESDAITTWNVKDFPKTYLNRFGISVITPDEMLVKLVGGQSGRLAMFLEEATSLSDPPITPEELFRRMQTNQLKKTAQKLMQMLKEQRIEFEYQFEKGGPKRKGDHRLPGKHAGERLYPCDPIVRKFWINEANPASASVLQI